MRQKIVGSAIEGFFCHNMVARAGKILQGVAYGCRSAGCGKSCHAAFERGHTLFKGILRGIGKTAVYVASIAEVKTGLSVRTVVKNKGCGLVDGYGARTCSLIRLFLPRMNLKGLKTGFLFFAHFCPLIQLQFIICT